MEDEKKPEHLENNEKRYEELYIAETKEKDLLQKNNGGCIGHTFPGWKYGDGWESATEDFSLDENPDKTKGCLAFNWDRKAENSGEGSNFRFVWTFEQNGAGFVVHLSGTVQKTPEMKFEGVAYAMKKESDE